MINADCTAEYTANLAHFIRDVRKDLKSPKLPFVDRPDGRRRRERRARTSRSSRTPRRRCWSVPEFKGNVALVKTDVFWDTEAEAVFKKGWRENLDEWNKVGSDYPYHYLGKPEDHLRDRPGHAEACLNCARNRARSRLRYRACPAG